MNVLEYLGVIARLHVGLAVPGIRNACRVGNLFESGVIDGEVKGIHLFAIIFIMVSKGVHASGIVGETIPLAAVISDNDSVGMDWNVNGKIQGDGRVAIVEVSEMSDISTGRSVSAVIPCIEVTTLSIY